jgi:DNA-directed RNA polymerase specialized sigma24 family protein
MAEHDLVHEVVHGSNTAWREFMRRYEPVIRHQIGKTLAGPGRDLSPSDAVDDILSRLWLMLIENDMSRLRAYNPTKGARLQSWLGLIATQAALRYLQKEHRAVQVRPDTEPDCDIDRGGRFAGRSGLADRALTRREHKELVLEHGRCCAQAKRRIGPDGFSVSCPTHGSIRISTHD